MPGLDFWRRHRRLVGLGLVAVVVAAGCLALGRWQWHRYQGKHARNALVQRNYDAPVVPLAALLPSPIGSTGDPGALPADRQWRPVRVVGIYDPSGTMLIRNRPRRVAGTDPTFGFEIVVPLRLADGAVLLVNRGWVPNATSGARAGLTPDAVPAPPVGRVTVVVTLRTGEPARAERLPAGQAASIAVPQLARAVGAPVYPGYGALRGESPAAAPAPLPPLRPENDGGEGINASYAVQWVLFAVVAVGFPFWYVRRSNPRPAGTPRPTKHRIWDDEDE